jgi:hypothetical protein
LSQPPWNCAAAALKAPRGGVCRARCRCGRLRSKGRIRACCAGALNEPECRVALTSSSASVGCIQLMYGCEQLLLLLLGKKTKQQALRSSCSFACLTMLLLQLLHRRLPDVQRLKGLPAICEKKMTACASDSVLHKCTSSAKATVFFTTSSVRMSAAAGRQAPEGLRVLWSKSLLLLRSLPCPCATLSSTS